MKSKRLIAVAVSLAVLSFNALAHGGAKPKHGGVVATSSDLNFELVATPTGAAVYIDDHGKAMAPTGMSGKLTVLNGATKAEVELVATGERLEASGVKLSAGTKAVAALTTASKKAITVRFTVK
jgi:hypothetical protein